MNRAEWFEAVENWQNCSQVNPVKCKRDSEHPKLVAFEDSKAMKVRLMCSTCSHTEEVPAHIILAYKRKTSWVKKD